MGLGEKKLAPPNWSFVVVTGTQVSNIETIKALLLYVRMSAVTLSIVTFFHCSQESLLSVILVHCPQERYIHE